MRCVNSGQVLRAPNAVAAGCRRWLRRASNTSEKEPVPPHSGTGENYSAAYWDIKIVLFRRDYVHDTTNACAHTLDYTYEYV